MMAPLRRFLSVFTLTSRVPVAVSFEPDYSRSDFWLPLIGPLASAAALAGAFAGSALLGSPLFAALFSMLFQYAAFNLFHLDGLLDSADALLPMAAPERRLEILKDSRIGTYAFFAGSLALALRVAALASLAEGSRGLALSPNLVAALLAAPAAGRAAAALVPRLTRPARPSGLGALMRGFSALRVAAGFALGLAPLAAWGFATGLAGTALACAATALVAAAVSGACIARFYREKVGGFTGDALGAAVEIGELLCLLAATALLPSLRG